MNKKPGKTERSDSKNSLKRKTFAIQEKRTIYIYCGGKNTEPSYFRKFRLANVTVSYDGKDPLTLTRQLIQFKKNSKFDEYWIVFDKDEFSDNDFNLAFQLALRNKINVAYSNQAFEYWLLLHFLDHNGSKLDRTDYGPKITKFLSRMGVEYDYKGTKLISESFFEILDSIDPGTGKIRVSQAIERAKKIIDKFDHNNPAEKESSTTVFLLVEELLKYRER